MKPIYQTIFEPPYGNCFQASVASVLELSLDEVPNFMLFQSEWADRFKRFLSDMNLYSVEISPFDANETTSLSRVDCFHLIAAKSPRGDYLHSLVGKNGIPIHDPFPGGNCEHLGLYSFLFIFPSLKGVTHERKND